MDEELVEKVADFMHDQWSHWMKYIFSLAKTDEELTVNTKVYHNTEDWLRWVKQMETPYSELSEKEKGSDREWARKLIQQFIICEYCKERTTMDICNTCRTDSKVWDDY